MLSVVREVIAEHLSLSEDEMNNISENAKLVEDLELDSLDAVEISMAIEDRLDIEFDESELDGISTVGDLVDVINKKRA